MYISSNIFLLEDVLVDNLRLELGLELELRIFQRIRRKGKGFLKRMLELKRLWELGF